MLSEGSRIVEGRHRADDMEFMVLHVVASVAFKLGLVGHTYHSEGFLWAVDLAARSTIKLEVMGLAEALFYFIASIFRATTIAIVGVAKLRLSFFVFAIFFEEVVATSLQARPSKAATVENTRPLLAVVAIVNRVIFAVFSVGSEQLSSCHSRTGTVALPGLEQATTIATAIATTAVATATVAAMVTAWLVAA